MSAAAVLLTVLLAQAPYVRLQTVNSREVTHCLWWPVAPLELRVHQDGSPEVEGETEFAAISRSLQTWKTEFDSCASLPISEGPRTANRWIGYNLKSPAANENLVLFRQGGLCKQVVPDSDPCWDESAFYCANLHDCWPHGAGAFAITTNTFNAESGRVFDSDVELNDGTFRFTATVATTPLCVAPNFENCVSTDVENTMTHEFGHVFGLNHDRARAGSTMYPEASVGATFMRDLDPGSQQFACEAYPLGLPPRDCVLETLDPDLGRSHCGAVGALPGLGLLLSALRRRRRG
ncbi:MAG: matrixin [Myxococcota bacterium]|nr:matrixin [Myxococcota bacterium]